MPSGKQKEIQQLFKVIRARGFKVVPSGSGHWRVLDKKGAVVVDDDGPVILSSTSSEARARAMTVKRLMNAKILVKDPWAPDKAKQQGENGQVAKDEIEEARREADAERRRTEDQQHGERTLAIRERFEPIVVRLGGWEKRGMVAEIGVVAFYFAERLKLSGRWSSHEAAAENADALRTGATLSGTMALLWEKLLDELESWPDTQLRWMQLLREAKGAAPPSIGEGEEEPFEDEPVIDDEPVIAGNGRLPTLALRAMYEMGLGRDDGGAADRGYVLKIGEAIARLELSVPEPTKEGDE